MDVVDLMRIMAKGGLFAPLAAGAVVGKSRGMSFGGSLGVACAAWISSVLSWAAGSSFTVLVLPEGEDVPKKGRYLSLTVTMGTGIGLATLTGSFAGSLLPNGGSFTMPWRMCRADTGAFVGAATGTVALLFGTVTTWVFKEIQDQED
eukprot:CAMPEP_0197634794 /NCGR_PEP_ID=MMETSP1338-20131121/10798_1 /TAXON_ID=43686 ORGANISM="Pelagodinium beii, Strain RCC1491" /NCGR_SAMPLE_ID=MMETSP1338 /ASSEMBLY_ACC=CAM_ASM_000754 /LENGTH=147 /DNA_ID=CAMNT_0043206731 /DNA_START=41 /DNA_END=484 /DNA_ORIENTATION=-